MNNKTKVKLILDIIKIQRKIIAKNVLLDPNNASTSINDYSYGIKCICDLINSTDNITDDNYHIKYINKNINDMKKRIQNSEMSEEYKFNIGMRDMKDLIESILDINDAKDVLGMMNTEQVKNIINAIKEQRAEIDDSIKNSKTCNIDYSNGVKDGMRYVSTFFGSEFDSKI